MEIYFFENPGSLSPRFTLMYKGHVTKKQRAFLRLFIDYSISFRVETGRIITEFGYGAYLFRFDIENPFPPSIFPRDGTYTIKKGSSLLHYEIRSRGLKGLYVCPTTMEKPAYYSELQPSVLGEPLDVINLLRRVENAITYNHVGRPSVDINLSGTVDPCPGICNPNKEPQTTCVNAYYIQELLRFFAEAKILTVTLGLDTGKNLYMTVEGITYLLAPMQSREIDFKSP